MAVTVYTNPSCVQCEQTKRYLNQKGIEYAVVDLSTDDDALKMVVDLGFKSAPVVITDDDKWAGFQLAKLAALAEKEGK